MAPSQTIPHHRRRHGPIHAPLRPRARHPNQSRRPEPRRRGDPEAGHHPAGLPRHPRLRRGGRGGGGGRLAGGRLRRRRPRPRRSDLHEAQGRRVLLRRLPGVRGAGGAVNSEDPGRGGVRGRRGVAAGDQHRCELLVHGCDAGAAGAVR